MRFYEIFPQCIETLHHSTEALRLSFSCLKSFKFTREILICLEQKYPSIVDTEYTSGKKTFLQWYHSKMMDRFTFSDTHLQDNSEGLNRNKYGHAQKIQIILASSVQDEL